MSEITKEMHRITDRIVGSNTKTFGILQEQWLILLNAAFYAEKTGYK